MKAIMYKSQYPEEMELVLHAWNRASKLDKITKNNIRVSWKLGEIALLIDSIIAVEITEQLDKEGHNHD